MNVLDSFRFCSRCSRQVRWSEKAQTWRHLESTGYATTYDHDPEPIEPHPCVWCGIRLIQGGDLCLDCRFRGKPAPSIAQQERRDEEQVPELRVIHETHPVDCNCVPCDLGDDGGLATMRDRQLADPEVKARIEDFRSRMARGDVRRGMTAKDFRRYWEEIDKDPEVRRRREAFRKAVQDGRVPEGAVYPSEYLKQRHDGSAHGT